MIDTGDIDVFLGLDVGKGEHHATAVTPAGKNAFGKRLLRCQSSCFLHVSVPACAPRSDDDHDAGRCVLCTAAQGGCVRRPVAMKEPGVSPLRGR
ncbi:hypothetical protein ACH4JZ_28335 [Streptomyces sp. NPDC017615]|uniref:hypothetical protein n=1 Tax=Streptomyces sp. NPDC017615 TaxID=3365003 RepID=UPI0037AD5484